MASGKGSNGILDGQANVKIFLDWVSNTKDFKPFIHQGILSTARVAKECELNRNVFYTNPDIRDMHLPALIKRLETEGVLQARVANPVNEIPRQPRMNAGSIARIKQIQEEAEAVKAENRELRRQLEKFKGIDEILHTTGRLPW